MLFLATPRAPPAPLSPPFPPHPLFPPFSPVAYRAGGAITALAVALCLVGAKGGKEGLLRPLADSHAAGGVGRLVSFGRWLRWRALTARGVRGWCVPPIGGVAGVHARSSVPPADFNMGGQAPPMPPTRRGAAPPLRQQSRRSDGARLRCQP